MLNQQRVANAFSLLIKREENDKIIMLLFNYIFDSVLSIFFRASFTLFSNSICNSE